MKRLIAKRPIQYMGRTYDRGEPVPADDSRMVGAWLSAGSIAWSGQDEGDAIKEQEDMALSVLSNAATTAVDTLHDMGVPIADEGAFLSVQNIAELIGHICTAICGNQEDANVYQKKDQEKEGAQEGGADGHSGQSAGAPEVLTIHMDVAQLERKTKDELIKLATDVGVDISEAKNNAERAALLVAVSIQSQKDNDGGAR